MAAGPVMSGLVASIVGVEAGLITAATAALVGFGLVWLAGREPTVYQPSSAT
jgi:hypothetical protein